MADDFWDCHTHVFGPAGRYPVSERGGYPPPLRRLGELEAAGQKVRVGHAVLVQPSIYGTDLDCLTDALRASDGRHRAVAVVPPSLPDDRLAELHGLGVRGVRFNLVSAGGNGLTGFPEIARRIAPLGWHAQFFIEPQALPEIVALRTSTGIPFVLDHIAGLTAAAGTTELQALLRLLATGTCWVKLSGFYRLSGAGAPYADLEPLLHLLGKEAPERLLWGSDWPHTWYFHGEHGPPPTYADTLAPILRCLPETTRRCVLRDNPAALYR